MQLIQKCKVYESIYSSTPVPIPELNMAILVDGIVIEGHNKQRTEPVIACNSALNLSLHVTHNNKTLLENCKYTVHNGVATHSCIAITDMNMYNLLI